MTMIDQNTTTTAAQPLRLMTITEVCQFTGLGESTVWDMSRRGRLPKPVKLGTRVTRWVSSELDAWVEDLAAKRA